MEEFSMKQQQLPQPATNDKITGYIYKTSDYDKFTLGENNREIKPANVKAKKESIRKFGILNPIVVDMNLEVREGNHRLVAMKELAKEGVRLPLYYIVKTTGADEMIAMNNTNVSWTSKDYVEHYANRGYAEYQKIVDLAEEHETSILAICSILFATYCNGPKLQAQFKEGKFGLTDVQLQDFEKFLMHCQELTPYIKQNKSTKMALYAIYKHPRYNQKQMLTKLYSEFSKTNKPINLTGTVDETRKLFLDIYNKGSKSTKIDYYITSNGQCKVAME